MKHSLSLRQPKMTRSIKWSAFKSLVSNILAIHGWFSIYVIINKCLLTGTFPTPIVADGMWLRYVYHFFMFGFLLPERVSSVGKKKLLLLNVWLFSAVNEAGGWFHCSAGQKACVWLHLSPCSLWLGFSASVSPKNCLPLVLCMICERICGRSTVDAYWFANRR